MRGSSLISIRSFNRSCGNTWVSGDISDLSRHRSLVLERGQLTENRMALLRLWEIKYASPRKTRARNQQQRPRDALSGYADAGRNSSCPVKFLRSLPSRFFLRALITGNVIISLLVLPHSYFIERHRVQAVFWRTFVKRWLSGFLIFRNTFICFSRLWNGINHPRIYILRKSDDYRAA